MTPPSAEMIEKARALFESKGYSTARAHPDYPYGISLHEVATLLQSTRDAALEEAAKESEKFMRTPRVLRACCGVGWAIRALKGNPT